MSGRSVPRGAEYIFAPIDRNADQPVLHVGVIFKRLVRFVKLYQHVLGHVVGIGAGAQIAVRYPKHRVHIPLRQRGKLLFCHA